VPVDDDGFARLRRCRNRHDGVGEGPPLVLVDGFASNRHGTWTENGWYETLADAGRRVVAIFL
jgi:hypothetical protein